MKKILALVLLFVIATGQAHAYNGGIATFSATDPYCGDDICSPGESCDACKWDCGVCSPEEGSGGGPIGVAPKKKNITLFDGQRYRDYPFDASTYSKSGENSTTIRFSMTNHYPSSPGAFRLHFESIASWFIPKNFSYVLDPDGYTGEGWPYWEIYSLEQNESIEIAFLTQGLIGSTSLVDIKAKPITGWGADCSDLKPNAPSITNATEDAIAKHVFSLNYTGDVKLYFEKKDANTTLALALVESEFGVFRINNTNVSVVSDNGTIIGLVGEYVSSGIPGTTVNVSRPYDIMGHSKNVSSGPQKSCFVITGMDRYECVNRTSCFYSCFSVPVCSYIATGWDFIDTILDYRKTVDTADLKFNKSIESAYAFKKAPSYESAMVALDDMKELNKAETKVINHSIYKVYNFCQPADYEIPQQIEARRIILDYIDDNCLKREEKEIINQSILFASGLRVNGKNISAENISAENASAVNISETPGLTIDTNLTNATANISREGEGDLGEAGLCLFFGEVWGLCLEVWAVILAILIIGIAVWLKRRRMNKE